MRLSSITVFLPFILAFASAIPAPGADAAPAPVILGRDYGCPYYPEQCNEAVLDL